MLSFARSRLVSNLITINTKNFVVCRALSTQKQETDEQFDAKWEAYFKNPDIDGWLLRKGINEMQGYDNFPEPKIVSAALEACKRVNDHSLAVRYLESLKWKAGNDAKIIYPWLLQEIKPTLEKLGISTPDELGYGKPELGLKSVFEMKGPNDY